MKKIFTYLAVLLSVFSFNTNAESTEPLFSQSGSFLLAKAVKLGRGSSVSTLDGSKFVGSRIKTPECSENCLNCNSLTGKCDTCESGYYLSSAGNCLPCSISDCAECDAMGYCAVCEDGYSLTDDGKCISNNRCEHTTIAAWASACAQSGGKPTRLADKCFACVYPEGEEKNVCYSKSSDLTDEDKDCPNGAIKNGCGVTSFNGKKCCVCQSSTNNNDTSNSNTCKQGTRSVSPPGVYYTGKVCFFGSIFAYNAWKNIPCDDYISCTTVASGNKCELDSNSVLVGGTCARK